MDVSLRAISSKHNMKISIVDLTESIDKITKLQKTNPLATIALGKITIANALIGLELKNHEMTTSNFTTNDGLAKTIISEFQGDRVRSFISNPQFDVNEITQEKDMNKLLGQVVGIDGVLTVSQSTLKGEPYVSRVSLVDGSIDLDYMSYLKTSNQITSFIATNVVLDDNLGVKKAVGILIQLFPEHTQEDLDYLATTIGSTRFISEILFKTTNYTALAEDIAEDAIVLETKELKFECTCSREKTINAVRLLDKQTVEEIVEAGKPIEVTCDFCKTSYDIDPKEIISEKTEK
ncbi:Hsp33 family molecular chaperone HslO [Mesoplasma lactucae]|uniref:Molecular chaperone Hsp33 n=1 Tax=Mesoplasma lactucae ATCC 49193 TaxID=81460 RepID=A0A291ISC1_9MOLU|nr:Hsp33 family molecular chaperone HslO [Mesoplasma lactucae]ATG97689.1 molecular chaperone Hsp33 [Mesoplasma lactucae ATCC 49193]ATZ19845.1 heat shock protein 33 [Mesoplasma lactucae ATCC 49193]MCL8216708.1 33 kDa chaperonin [Mesoplasma lactucae ATCC 49193]